MNPWGRVAGRHALAAALLALAGCSSVVDPDPPAPLPLEEAPAPALEIWRQQVGVGAGEQQVYLQPALADGVLYVADRKGVVLALEAASGAERWRRETGLSVTGALAAAEGMLLLGTSDAEVIALDATDGTERWRAAVSSEVLSSPQALDGVVVAQTVDDRTFGIAAETGARRWSYQRRPPALTLRGTASPALAEGRAFIGLASGKLIALDLADGGLVWEAAVTLPRGSSELDRMVDLDATPLVAGDLVFAAAYQGRLAAIARSTGVIIWSRDISSYRAPALDGDRLLVTDARSHVWAIAPGNGAALWKQDKLQARALSAPTAIGDYVVVGDFEGYLHFLARADGRLLGRVQIDGKGVAQAPLAAGRILYAYGRGGILTALQVEEPR